MRKRNPKVDDYLSREKTWQKEMKRLRTIALGCGLTEELKWGKPCYTFEGSNIVILQGFKEFCAVLFPSGALLKDPRKILQRPGKHTQAARRIPFSNLEQVAEQEPALESFIRRAIDAQKSGEKLNLKKQPEPMPRELLAKFKKNAAFKSAFNALTPGRQRAYILYISAARQEKTREARVDKCLPKILQGKGLNDR